MRLGDYPTIQGIQFPNKLLREIYTYSVLLYVRSIESGMHPRYFLLRYEHIDIFLSLFCYTMRHGGIKRDLLLQGRLQREIVGTQFLCFYHVDM